MRCPDPICNKVIANNINYCPYCGACLMVWPWHLQLPVLLRTFSTWKKFSNVLKNFLPNLDWKFLGLSTLYVLGFFPAVLIVVEVIKMIALLFGYSR